MRRLGGMILLAIGLSAGAAGGYWYARPPAGMPAATIAPETAAAACGTQDPLLPRPERRAVLVGRAEEGRRKAATIFRFSRTKKSRSSPAARSRRHGGRPAQDSVLPQSHGPARHLAGPEEGLDGDGLHPGLRRRGAGRRQDRQGQPRQGPAQRRAHRNGRSARDRAAGPRRRHGHARRIPLDHRHHAIGRIHRGFVRQPDRPACPCRRAAVPRLQPGYSTGADRPSHRHGHVPARKRCSRVRRQPKC